MYNLTQDEINLLNSDPKFAAVALKLKEAEDKGEFIPKSRFSEELKKKKELEDRLKAIEEAQKLADEEKARKNGELDKLLEAEKKAKADVEARLAEEKKEADAYRAYRKAVVEKVKADMGDKWLPEFENFSLESLAKVSGSSVAIPGVEKGHPTLLNKATIEQQMEEARKKGNNVEVIALRRKLTEQNSA